MQITNDERQFMKRVPLPPKSRRLPPRSINRNHLIDVEESVEGRDSKGRKILRTYDYILHATKGWRRRRVISKA